MRPIACMISDRRRLGSATPALVERARAAASAGVQLIQLRERDLDGRALCELARTVVDAVRGTATRVVINERVDVALASGAHGVHLRVASFRASRVRPIVPPGFLIGQSVHSASEVAELGTDVDYFLFGNVFPTASKPGAPGAGVAGLSDVVRATPIPVLALGGITGDRVPQILAAGAAGFAGISLFVNGPIQ